MSDNVLINPDLLKERANPSFVLEELTNFIDGSAELTAKRRKLEEYFREDLQPPKVPLEYLSHKEKYDEALKRSTSMFRKFNALMKRENMQLNSIRSHMTGSLGIALLADGSPLLLNYVMFIPALFSQASQEQCEYWIKRTWNFNIIGTYAQTELGHGTFIRGLETTATYDQKTQEFILNSPTLSAYKWWPGGLGHTANYAVVVAQLHTQGECKGIHPFIVQLRDEETHEPMRGIKIGEIGAKMGFNLTNNGYLGFENVRIPRTNMLMKYSVVEPNGTYVKISKSVLIYSTMIYVRVGIVEEAMLVLKNAVLIVVRYSAVRRQCQLKQDEQETQVINFITQQYKIFPELAKFFALLHVSQWLWKFYFKIVGEIENGNIERLSELHATASCFKALSTTDATVGIEICRLACGGHGYMQSSNFPCLYAMSTAACTYEGDNTVLLLQTARFLVKSYQGFMQGQKLCASLEYLSKYQIGQPMPVYQQSAQWILNCFEYISMWKISHVCKKMEKLVYDQGKSFEDAWNLSTIELCEVAMIHCRTQILNIYNMKMQKSKMKFSSQLMDVLLPIFELYAVNLAIEFKGDFIQHNLLSAVACDELQAWLLDVLAAIRPNAINVIDAFDLPDEIVKSTLGSYDGKVYERLFNEASKSPLNQQPVDESFARHLKPFVKSAL